MSQREEQRGVRMLIASGALAALLTIGCSGEDSPAAPETSAGRNSTITVVAADWAFNVDRIEVPVGSTTTILLDNRDGTAHTLTAFVGASAEGDVAADTGEVGGGQTGEAVVFFSAPGSHAFRCEIHPGKMNGVIVVR